MGRFGSGTRRGGGFKLGYTIGVAQPVSISADTFGTGRVSDRLLENWIYDTFDLRPAAIIEKLKLRRPIYASTSVYGHFGRTDESHTWEIVEESLIESARRLLV